MPRVSNDKKRKVLYTVFSVVAAIILVAGLAARIKLTEINDNNAALIQECAKLHEENARLRIAYESSIDLNELEEYAKNVLGMQKPESERIIHIDVDTRDKAVILKDSAKADGEKLVSSILEYLSGVKCKFN